MSNKQLQVLDVIESAGLEKDTTQTLRQKFLPFWEQAEKWRDIAEGLVVTDASQTREMKMAREARLALRAIRVEADKTRKALKEDSIRYGKAVQGVYNVIEYLIKPIEEHLQEQENFVLIQEQNRRDALNEERERLIAPYLGFVTADLPLTNTPWAELGDRFDAILAQAQADKKAHDEEQARREAERIAKEKAEAEERERIRKENERLRAERAELERKQAEERRKLEEQARKEREEAEKKLAAERAERERLEAEARKREAEEQARREAEEAERRKAAAAPDKEKLMKWVKSIEQFISWDWPELETTKAAKLNEEIDKALGDVLTAAKEKINKL